MVSEKSEDAAMREGLLMGFGALLGMVALVIFLILCCCNPCSKKNNDKRRNNKNGQINFKRENRHLELANQFVVNQNDTYPLETVGSSPSVNDNFNNPNMKSNYIATSTTIGRNVSRMSTGHRFNAVSAVNWRAPNGRSPQREPSVACTMTSSSSPLSTPGSATTLTSVETIRPHQYDNPNPVHKEPRRHMKRVRRVMITQ